MKIYNKLIILVMISLMIYCTYNQIHNLILINVEVQSALLEKYSTFVINDDRSVYEIYPYIYDTNKKEEIISEPIVELVDDEQYYQDNGLSWMIRKVQDGEPVEEYKIDMLTYNSENQLLNEIVIPDSVVRTEGQPEMYAYGANVEESSFFKTSRITTYGVDCAGCSGEVTGYGTFAAGVKASTTAVLQSDGSWKDGITYDGYYIIAADSSLPLCTVVEISNHRISGSGITSGVPFQAIVLDRGNSIQSGHIDFFEGSQNDGIKMISSGKSSGVEVKIIEFGTKLRNGCRIS